jgi:hypothetical protein
MSTFLVNVNRETRSLTQKLAILESNAQLAGILFDNSVCDFEFKNAGSWRPGPGFESFDASMIGTTNEPVIKLDEILVSASAAAPVFIKVGSPLSSQESSVVVNAIEVSGLSGSPGDTVFPAKLTIKLDQSRLIRTMRDIQLNIILLTSGAGANKTVTGCMQGGGGSNGKSMTTTVSNLSTFHNFCGPGSGYSWFDSPYGNTNKALSSGGLLKHCMAADLIRKLLNAGRTKIRPNPAAPT